MRILRNPAVLTNILSYYPWTSRPGQEGYQQGERLKNTTTILQGDFSSGINIPAIQAKCAEKFEKK